MSLSPTEICAADCGGHGVCVSGTCRCDDGWMGAGCDQRACHPRCNEHGTCKDGKCECSPGWNGEHCTIGRKRVGSGLGGGTVSMYASVFGQDPFEIGGWSTKACRLSLPMCVSAGSERKHPVGRKRRKACLIEFVQLSKA